MSSGLSEDKFNTASGSTVILARVKDERSVPTTGDEATMKTITESLVSQNGYYNWQPFEISNDLMIDRVMVGSHRVPDHADVTLLVPESMKNITFYKLNTDGPQPQFLGDNRDDENAISSSTLWQLPALEFEGIFENLTYSDNIKNELISFVNSLMRLSQKRVDTNIINVNRLIMLTGPPGTGKTSLCKGLAQILSIKTNHIYSNSVLIEINAHSLFSKWFSESGKLIQGMFENIGELAVDPTCLIFVLIDEVESLGMSRELSSTKSEPTDGIRAVNALLTQIDKIRAKPNVLVMCTSNLSRNLDNALTDRADLIREIEVPKAEAIYALLYRGIKELHREKISPDLLLLQKIVDKAKGMSARSINRLPVYVLSNVDTEVMDLKTVLTSLLQAVSRDKLGRTRNYGSKKASRKGKRGKERATGESNKQSQEK